MRTIRALTIAATVIAALPALAGAQAGRQFKDSWFWGVKTGGFTVADSAGNTVFAPTIGAEWLVTRTRGGVYLSASQSFFKHHSFTLRDPVSIDSGLRAISLHNLRRFDAMAVGFPMPRKSYNAYGAVGFSVQQIASAIPEGPFTNVDQLNFAVAVIDEQKVVISPIVMGGIQWRLPQASVFGQISVNPTPTRFIGYNGQSWNFAFELGVRYNVGKSVDPAF